MSEPVRVLQSLPLWLPLTSPWLFNQVSYLPGDVEVAVFAERTANLDQFAFAPLRTLESAPRPQQLYERGLRKLGVRDQLGMLVREARRHRADIVHSHWGDWGWRDREGVRRAGALHVVTFYGKDVNFLPQQQVWRDRYAELLAGVDLVLCEGPFMAQCIVALGLPEDRVRVLHLGVETHRFDFRPRRWERGTPLRALIAASFREKKGIPYAIEALGRIQDEVEVELTVIGDASEDPRSGPEKEAILAALDASGLRERTRLLGYQKHAVMLEAAYRSHVFLSPSVAAADGDTEGGAPVSLIEMAATGMPLITTTHCDIPEVVADRSWLAPERDVDALEANLRRLIATPDWEPMLAAERAHIEREFDVREQARRLAELYRSLA